jgi:hypothetical protein
MFTCELAQDFCLLIFRDKKKNEGTSQRIVIKNNNSVFVRKYYKLFFIEFYVDICSIVYTTYLSAVAGVYFIGKTPPW